MTRGMTRGIRVLACVAVAALVAAVGSAIREDAVEVPEATGQLRIDVPSRLDAGTPLRVEMTGANPNVGSAVLVVTTSAGSHSTVISLRSGRGRVDLDPELTQSAGQTEIWAVAGADQAVAALRIDADEPVEPIVPLVGPKTIVADGQDHAMVVALISDRFGNPVPSRMGAEVGTLHPGRRESRGTVESTGLVVWRRVFSGTLAGRAGVVVSLGSMGGPVADLDEVAGAPASIEVLLDRTDEVPLRADGRRLHRVVTDRIVDRFGNVVTDGTAIIFRIDDPTGRRILTAPTIDGRAEAWVEAPALPGPLEIVATSSGVDSPTLRLDFTPAIDAVSTQVLPQRHGWTIAVGPVTTVDGGWIPDGTTIAVMMPGRPTVRAAAVDGGASFDIAGPLPNGTSVEVLGVRRPIT